jgi:hypothetical protein
LYAHRSSKDEQLLIRPFKKTIQDGGLLKLKIHITFMETAHEQLNLRQMQFGPVNDQERTYKFYLNNYTYHVII